jgi:hypothetical protein
MRIKSSFKDYYDSVMGLGFDQELTYLRKIELSNYLFPGVACFNTLGKYESYHNHGIDFSHITICFCGYNYTCFQVGDGGFHIFTSGAYKLPQGYNYFYDIDSLDKYIDTQHKDVIKRYHEPPKGKWYSYKDTVRANCERLLARNGSKHSDFDNIQLFGCPILVQNGPLHCEYGYKTKEDHPTTVHNAPLRMYEFHRVKDAYTCYQEINQFLSNVAHPNRPIPHVSDKDMIVAKGFDLKTSFRKDKKKKK